MYILDGRNDRNITFYLMRGIPEGMQRETRGTMDLSACSEFI
jgi:hypothetical protein